DAPAILVQIEAIDFLNMTLAWLEHCLNFPDPAQLPAHKIRVMVLRRQESPRLGRPCLISVVGYIHFLSTQQLEIEFIHLAVKAIDLVEQQHTATRGTDRIVLELRRKPYPTLPRHVGPSHAIT